MLLWLWGRPAAIAPIQLLAWELPYAAGAAIESKKKQNKNKQTKKNPKNKTIDESKQNAKISPRRGSIVAQQERTQLISRRMQVRFLASLSGLRVWCCRELGRRRGSDLVLLGVGRWLQLRFDP